MIKNTIKAIAKNMDNLTFSKIIALCILLLLICITVGVALVWAFTNKSYELMCAGLELTKMMWQYGTAILIGYFTKAGVENYNKQNITNHINEVNETINTINEITKN